ncbi:hypothetical protein LCGC14_2308740 [marine sediment metagenome]|uniref:Uncharacterized protein n=1 Tax=marine sediment metagenome TaxID=412755 RepID=A0A0F9EYM7_9ZZZZ
MPRLRKALALKIVTRNDFNIMKVKNKIPSTLNGWLGEISGAYNDAFDTIPYGPLVGQKITPKELFHLGPAVCIKFRGIKNTEKNLKQATDAALSSYVATEEVVGDLFKIPQMAFAFSYMVSHYGLDIVADEMVSKVMEYLEVHLDELKNKTKKS